MPCSASDEHRVRKGWRGSGHSTMMPSKVVREDHNVGVTSEPEGGALTSAKAEKQKDAQSG